MIRKALNAENLALLAIVLLPAYLVRFAPFGLPTNLLEILMAAFILRALAEKDSRKRIRAFLKGHGRELLPIMAILAGLLLSIAFNPDKKAGLGILKGWFLLPIAFSLTVAALGGRIGIRRVSHAFYLSGFVTASVSLVCFMSGRMTYDGRLEGFFNSPNYLAMYLALPLMAGFLGLLRFRESGRSLPKIVIGLASLLVIAAAFYLTRSYAAWLAVLIAIPLAFPKRARNGRMALLIILVAAAWAFLAQGGTEKMEALLSFDSRSSLASRLMIWRSALAILKSHWLFGIGPSDFQAFYLEYQRYYPPYLEWAVPHPHDTFLWVWLSSGIIGLAGFVRVVFGKAKAVFLDRNEGGAAVVRRSFIVFFVVASLFDTYMKNDLAVVFWLMMFL